MRLIGYSLLALLLGVGCSHTGSRENVREPASEKIEHSTHLPSVLDLLISQEHTFGNCACIETVNSQQKKCSNLSPDEKKEISEIKIQGLQLKKETAFAGAYGVSTSFGSVVIDKRKLNSKGVGAYTVDWTNTYGPVKAPEGYVPATLRLSYQTSAVGHNYVYSGTSQRDFLHGGTTYSDLNGFHFIRSIQGDLTMVLSRSEHPERYAKKFGFMDAAVECSKLNP